MNRQKEKFSRRKRQTLSEAGPSVPASITGLDVPPKAGEEFVVVTSEKMA